MRMVAPRTGAQEITVAENQTEYKPVVVALYRYPEDDPDYPGAPFVLSRWRLTEEERGAVAAGEDLYIAHLTFGGSLQPLSPQIGPGGYTLEPDN